jgi:osomolarity two-component system sensor histidine kinase NIK1
MTTPCKLIDLGNGMVPALENRATPSLADNTRSFEILLAEDNTVNQRLAVKILEKYHHVVTVVGNGKEAVDAVKRKKFDVILMDVQMPIMVSFSRLILITSPFQLLTLHRVVSKLQERSVSTSAA